MNNETKVDLAKILADHAAWRIDYNAGKAEWYDSRRADLSGADLRDANLRDANLRGAVGLPYVPIVQNIDQRILAAVEADSKALDMSQWHTCETTHCRAGWAIHLAGDGGRVLESIYGSEVAGTLIYLAARPGKKHPDFFASNEDALASIRADAAEAVSA